MYSVYSGNDTIGVREAAFKEVSKYEKKGFVVERIDTDNFSAGILADAAGATSLFGDQTVYVVDTPSMNKDFYADVIEHLSVLSESENPFIIVESSLLAPEKKKFAKYAEALEEVKGEKGERFNSFALAEALSKRDKKSLWLLLQEARLAGSSDEEIIGILWWQLKALRLAAKTKSANEAGMKDFPYNKAKRSLSNFKDGDVERISHNLLSVYHDGHLGKRDIDLALERWTLTL